MKNTSYYNDGHNLGTNKGKLHCRLTTVNETYFSVSNVNKCRANGGISAMPVKYNARNGKYRLKTSQLLCIKQQLTIFSGRHNL